MPVVSQAKPISPVASIACKHARIGGQSKCIARGQYCARRYERDYERYGYHCTIATVAAGISCDRGRPRIQAAFGAISHEDDVTILNIRFED